MPSEALADISACTPGQDTKPHRLAPIASAIPSLAGLGRAALAIASAPAAQCLSVSTAPIALGATAIASALATLRHPDLAPLARRSAAQRSTVRGSA